MPLRTAVPTLPPTRCLRVATIHRPDRSHDGVPPLLPINVRTADTARVLDLSSCHQEAPNRAARSDSNVNSSDSRGIDVTNGPIIQPRPNGMSRVKESDSHCTYVPASRCSREQ